MSQLRMVWTVARAILTRPRLWGTALVQARRFAPDRWWRTAPFLPLPDRDLAGFRSETQYGDQAAMVTAEDLVVWLEWCRQERNRT